MGKTVYFRDDDMRLSEIADRNPEYIRVYMNVCKHKNTTEIKLSKGTGDILYILSDTDAEKYSDYFKNELPGTKKVVDTKKNGEMRFPKRMKQSTLSFLKNG